MTNINEVSAKELSARIQAGLRERILGLDSLILEVANNIALWKGGKAPQSRPAASFLLVGPRGIGKSALALATASVIHANPKALLKLDGGTFKGTSDMTRLIGAGPRYTGGEIEPIFAQARIDRLRA